MIYPLLLWQSRCCAVRSDRQRNHAYGDASTLSLKGTLIGIIALVYFITFLILQASTRLVRILGETGNNVMMRLMGLILMVIAVECFVSGLKPILIDILREAVG